MAKPTRFTQNMIDHYVAMGYWDSMTSADFLERNADAYPEQEAFIDSRTRLTWKDVKTLSDRLALGFVQRGIERDDVVVAMVPNVVENAVLRFALEKAGAISLFVPMTARQAEIDKILKVAEPAALIMLGQYRGVDYLKLFETSPFKRRMKQVFLLDPDRVDGTVSLVDTMKRPVENEFPVELLRHRKFTFSEVSSIQLTSGSTGTPKLCEWPIAPSLLFAKTFIARGGLKPGDRIGALAPLSGGPGLISWLAGPQIPAPVVLLEHFDPDAALQLVEKEKITVLCVVPTMVIRMASHNRLSQYNLGSLRLIRVGGAALPPKVAQEIEQKMGCLILPAAGCSEGMSIGHTNCTDPPLVRLATIGKPWLGNEARIVDPNGGELPRGEVGEIWVSGACTASGFYNDVETTKKVWGVLGEEGWCRTGDLGKMDLEGNIIIVGRIKDIIIRGGQNIYPREIEMLLSSHPDIMEVAVVPIPDAELGEKACACIILKPGSIFDFEQMVEFLKSKDIAMYKIPERLEILERFPMIVDGGKVDKATLSRSVRGK